MERKYRIGVDLGGTNIKTGIIDEHCTLIVKKSAKTYPIGRPWQEVVNDIALLILDTLATINISLEQCEKIGIGSPGMVDHANGVIVFAGNFDWNNVPIAEELRKHINLPSQLSNDGNCAVIGEVVAGAAKGSKDVVMLTLGTGLGSGVISGGILQEGGSSGGMEIGHSLLMMDGEYCTCGRRGCFEAYASANALIRQARYMAIQHPNSLLASLCNGNPDEMRGEIPFSAARKGDAYAQIVVNDYIRFLGEGIINCINIWRPEKVLLGGGVSHAGDQLLVPLNQYVSPRVFAGNRGCTAPILQAVLGNDAGIIGAAVL